MSEETRRVLREIQDEIVKQTKSYFLSSPGGAYSAGEYRGLMKAYTIISNRIHPTEKKGELTKAFEGVLSAMMALPDDDPTKVKFRKQMAKVLSFDSLKEHI